ncbi:hypothetical protein K450DRAFT_227769 [Umbelopsis ramanniana AG]|uniref:Uncharacterized protein n=1 Tax=Umbelopsis ramanniana AG TaxID=1314678 RepID=A0AAD5EHU0_UMBRA|nr:uncharacterized protein K450DRAFT_227769 [Umbelopsis ramanniana AG]KAI8582565.1 hypothetical protein K450DRAFT_227769 [Umbelopsis ramanniana AG]
MERNGILGLPRWTRFPVFHKRPMCFIATWVCGSYHWCYLRQHGYSDQFDYVLLDLAKVGEEGSEVPDNQKCGGRVILQSRGVLVQTTLKL